MTVHPGLAGLLSLRDHVALVTGGSGGIGAAVVRHLLDAAAQVLSVDLATRNAVEGSTRLACDVSDRAQVERLAASVREEHGRLDILVHCAGITRDAVLWKMEPAAWSEVIATNLDSAFHLLHDLAPLMRAAGGGSIVLVSSINGERGRFGQANYAASKAGLIGLAKTAARELGAFGIRVNCVAPGLIRTPMTQSLGEERLAQALAETVLGRLGEPDDVANAVLFLCSQLGRHVSGQVLRVDGGQWMA